MELSHPPFRIALATIPPLYPDIATIELPQISWFLNTETMNEKPRLLGRLYLIGFPSVYAVSIALYAGINPLLDTFASPTSPDTAGSGVV